MKKSELFFTFLLVPLDIVMIFGGFVLSYWLRAHQEVIYIWPFNEYLRFIFLLLPFWIAIFALEGLYSTKNGRRGADELIGVILGVSSGIMLLVGWLFISQTTFFSRLVVIYSWVSIIVLVFASRQIIRLLQRYLYRYGIGVHRVIFLGNNQATYNLIKAVQGNRALGYKLIGVINTDHTSKNNNSSLKTLGDFDNLVSLLKKYPTDEIILTDSNMSDKKIAELIDFCEDKNLIFKQTPNLFELKSPNTEVIALAGIPIMRFRRTPLDGWGAIIKRLVDVFGAFFGLIILSPLFLVVSIIVKVVSPGPVFFRQTRMRENGRTFTFLKFRSMYTDLCTGDNYGGKKAEDVFKKLHKHNEADWPVFKLKNDPRVTPFGKFIRKTSIDELPQLWNVLIGDMSLVGPRPPMPEEVKQYTALQKKRLTIRPGITGLWQVSGRSDVNFDDWVRLDIYYIENWSLWLDLKILARTFLVVLVRKGAY